MDDEVSSVNIIGLTLMFLALFISIGFFVYKVIHYETMSITDSTVSINNNRNSADLYSDYDNTIVSGTQVIDALYKFAVSDISILIGTQDFITNVRAPYMAGATSEVVQNSRLRASYDNLGYKAPIVYVKSSEEFANSNAGTGNEVIKGLDGENQAVALINYRAILGSMSNKAYAVDASRLLRLQGVAYYPSNLYFSGDELVCEPGLVKDTRNNHIYNNNFTNLNVDGATERVMAYGRYNSYLVKDPLGNLLGFAFIEVTNDY